MLGGLWRRKGLLLVLVPVCSSLIAPAVCGGQQQAGHQMASPPADSNGIQRAAPQRSLLVPWGGFP